MERELEEFVWGRAGYRCEYCLLPHEFSEAPFEIDHIIAQKHSGPTTAGNLALACYYCNSYKGPNIAGIDPVSGRIVRLFNPRRDRWNKHFAWSGDLAVGLTSIGRATIHVLWMNHPLAVETRRLLREFKSLD